MRKKAISCEPSIRRPAGCWCGIREWYLVDICKNQILKLCSNAFAAASQEQIFEDYGLTVLRWCFFYLSVDPSHSHFSNFLDRLQNFWFFFAFLEIISNQYFVVRISCTLASLFVLLVGQAVHWTCRFSHQNFFADLLQKSYESVDDQNFRDTALLMASSQLMRTANGRSFLYSSTSGTRDTYLWFVLSDSNVPGYKLIIYACESGSIWRTYCFRQSKIYGYCAFSPYSSRCFTSLRRSEQAAAAGTLLGPL